MSYTLETPVSRFDTFVSKHTDFLSHSDATEPSNILCPICTEGITEHICVKIVNIEGCKHLVGLECLRQMFKHSSTDVIKCPLCRAQWVSEDGGRQEGALGNAHGYGYGYGYEYGTHGGYEPVRRHGRDAFMHMSNTQHSGDSSLQAESTQYSTSRHVGSLRQTNPSRHPDASRRVSTCQPGALHHYGSLRRTDEFRHTPFRFPDILYRWSSPTVVVFPSISQSHEPSRGRSHAGHNQSSRDTFENVSFEGFARHSFRLDDEHDSWSG
jgi:hypothetical protein